MKRTDQKFTFRVDASSQIGTGHFMRCLSLAEALKKNGAQIRFISRHLPEHLRDILTEEGIEFILLGGNASASPTDELAHAQWLQTSQCQDAQATIRALSDGAWDWLIVDHYSLDSRWESMLRQSVKKILVIDDIADRQHDCDLLLDQNFYTDMESRYIGRVPSHCQLLLGPRYALLRDEFQRLHKQITPRREPVKQVMIFFGGVDINNYTGRAIEALSEIDIAALHVDVVIGQQHPYREQIKMECAQKGLFFHVQTDKMAKLMASADLAIGAGGSAIWERCCLGLPTLTFCTAINQEAQITNAAQDGLLYAPSLGTDITTVIKKHVTALLENSHLRRFISNRAMQTVDGRGVLRIIGILGCSGIKMREVNADDSPKLFEWRNHPRIRSVSRNTEPISWEDHQAWFADAMYSNNIILLIGQIGEITVGVVRFDKHETNAEISIYLVPDDNHSGQGRNLLLSGEQWIKEKRPEIKSIQACVIGNNEPSQRLFLGAGYQVKMTHYVKNN